MKSKKLGTKIGAIYPINYLEKPYLFDLLRSGIEAIIKRGDHPTNADLDQYRQGETGSIPKAIADYLATPQRKGRGNRSAQIGVGELIVQNHAITMYQRRLEELPHSLDSDVYRAALEEVSTFFGISSRTLERIIKKNKITRKQ